MIKLSGQLVDLSLVHFFDFQQLMSFLIGNQVNGNTSFTKSTGSSDSVNVILMLRRQLIVNNKPNRVNIDSSGQQISRYQNSTGSFSELRHDFFSLFHFHRSVNVRNHEILFFHSFGQFFALVFCVDVNKALVDFDVSENFDQIFEFCLFVRTRNIVLFYTVKGQIFFFDQNLNRIVHNVLSEFYHFFLNCCGK